MDLIQRLPDKPWQRSESSLLDLDKTPNYIATYKYDGWRCLVVIDDDISFWSRHRNKLPVSAAIRRQVMSMGLPKKTVIDTEWMDRRPGHVGEELLYIITIMYFDGQWMGKVKESDRWAKCNTLPTCNNIKIPISSRCQYYKLYNESKKDRSTEGIVLKHVDSMLIGDNHESKNNGMWIKIRWR